MGILKPLDLENLHDDAFIGERTAGVVKIKPKISSRSGNSLRLTQQGLDVDLGDIREYTASWTSNARSGANDTRERRLMQISTSGFGSVHLDVILGRRGNHDLATFLDGTPTPNRLIEVQTHDGGFIYMDANSRTIKSRGLNINTRYVVDLVGFFS